MQYSLVTLVALAATASASYSNTTTSAVEYTTEVHTAYTTVCPSSTELTFNGVTYTATASQTLTVTNCPCTVVKPVYSTTSTYCPPTSTPHANATVVAPTYSASTPKATPITASSGSRVFAFSGASLAGLLGLAAFIL
jgi:hypothetical protein